MVVLSDPTEKRPITPIWLDPRRRGMRFSRPMMNKLVKTMLDYLGVDRTPATHAERLISALGGFLGIFAIFQITRLVLSDQDAVLIVASMGASAVLLFAVPAGKLSQPWSLIGGHLVSATIGVFIAGFVHDPFLAGALAVGLAIGAMHYLGCTHPPGGASALVAVVGGPSVHALGYGYVLAPVLLNALVILVIALLFNNLFDSRRYPAAPASAAPAAPAPAPSASDESAARPCSISKEDLDYAGRKLSLEVSLTSEQIDRFYAFAARRAAARSCVEPTLETSSENPSEGALNQGPIAAHRPS